MATKVHMEALSPTMEEGQLVKWLKNEGDAIAEGDVLAEIETDKATMELVARGSGTLRNVSLAAGQTAPVGTVIAEIGEAGEAPAERAEAPAERAEAPAAAEAAVQATAMEKGGAAAAAEAEEGAGAPPATAARATPAAAPAAPARPTGDGARDEGRLKASPLARRLAAESGVELSAVEGTGPGGRITKRDIEAAAQTAPPAAPARAPEAAAPAEARPAAAVAPAVAAGPDSEEIPLSQMRKTIAKRLAQSIGPIPTFYLTIECDMSALLQLRERTNRMLEKDGIKASINDFIIKVVATALARHPEVNAFWGENAIIRNHRVHIGVAVAVEDGLITPVIRDADRKRVRDIAVEVKELAGRARDKRLKPDEYTGATFSISNLGMFGIVEFTAIINPPESGIIAVGSVEEKAIVENGEVVVRPRMRMTMSCDHRVVDGATGARFLQTVRELTEDPLLMIA